MKVLLVEDEQRVADFVARGLRAERHVVTVVGDGVAAIEHASQLELDVVILDLMLPGMHGLEVCRTLRQRGIATPILMLSALDAVEDRVEGLRIGADDYLTKPFDFEELLARLAALARRPRQLASEQADVRFGDLVYDRAMLEVRGPDGPIRLTAKELAILELLLGAPGKLFSRERILNSVWSTSEDPLTNIVDVYIARLRKKLSAGRDTEIIETVRGLGYRINARLVGGPG